MSKPKSPRVPNQLAKPVVAIPTGETERQEGKLSSKNPASVEPGRIGELNGVKFRAKKLTAEQKSEVTTKRWQHAD